MSLRSTVAARMRRTSAVALVLGAAVVAGAAPAIADEGAPNSQTCWLNADTDAFAHFDTYDKFVAASGVAPSQGVGARSEVEPYAAYVFATFYEDASYGGASVNVTTSKSAMCAGYIIYGTAMPSGWNDRVSSFKGYGTCKIKLFSNPGYGGSTFGPYASASSIGSMNDEASSYQASA